MPLSPTTAVKPSKDKKAPVKKKGGSTLGLWLLVLGLLLVALAGGTYVLQDTLIKYWPGAEEYLILGHFRHERPGAGLELKRVGEIERVVINNVNAVVIRGIIINVSGRPRQVPPMKLVLQDKDGNPLQEKIDHPPVTSLEPTGTSSFKIIMERPDANARTMFLEFIEPPASAGGETAPAAPPPEPPAMHQGIITPPPLPAPPPPVAPVAAPAAPAPTPAPAAHH